MKMKFLHMISIAALIAASGPASGAGKSADGAPGRPDGSVRIVDGPRSWRFVPVDGTSRLPLGFMRGGGSRTNLTAVTLPRFWIADRMVTEGDYAALTGGKVRPGRKAEQALCGIEWEEALDWCAEFTRKHAAGLPADAVVSIPTIIEWAHAVKVLEGKEDLSGEVGTFLFTGNQFGGFLASLGKFHQDEEKDFDLAVDLMCVPKRMRQEVTGLRPVIVTWGGGDMSAGGKKDDNAMVSRGSIMAMFGLYGRATEYLRKLLERGGLSDGEMNEVESVLSYCTKKHDEDPEDWSGLVARAGAYASQKGYVVSPFTEKWQWAGVVGAGKDDEVVSCYDRHGIVGGWMKIGNLPPELRKDQSVGEDYDLLTYGKDGPRQMVGVPITDDTVVQTVSCDFTGDGRRDLLVEQFGYAGSGGYWYGFYARQADGSYTNVLRLQTVGLCVLPAKRGKGCAFLHVEKVSNPVLAAKLLRFENGKASFENANPKPFYLLDARENGIYTAAPFVGAGYGIGWRFLEGRGVWYRPLFWPWKPGKVQGYEEACRKAGIAEPQSGG